MNFPVLARSTCKAIAACLVLAISANNVFAQVDPARTAPPAGGRGGQPKPPRRPVVEKLQQRVDNMLRIRLQLTDDQFNKMRALNGRLDEEKRAQRAEEAEVRSALRAELLPDATPNESRIAELLDKLPAVERRRIALQEREQKELATFMRPAQRARFFALQDELRRSLQDVQRQRGRGGPMDDSIGPPRLGRGAGRGMRPPLPPFE